MLPDKHLFGKHQSRRGSWGIGQEMYSVFQLKFSLSSLYRNPLACNSSGLTIIKQVWQQLSGGIERENPFTVPLGSSTGLCFFSTHHLNTRHRNNRDYMDVTSHLKDTRTIWILILEEESWLLIPRSSNSNVQTGTTVVKRLRLVAFYLPSRYIKASISQ